jgi:hypothetical protein
MLTKATGLVMPLVAGGVTYYAMDTVYTNLPRSLNFIKCWRYSREAFAGVPAVVVFYRMAR